MSSVFNKSKTLMKIFIDYIWIDANGEFRTKTRVLNSNNPYNVKTFNIKNWKFNGKLTGDNNQLEEYDIEEVELIPIKTYKRTQRNVAMIPTPNVLYYYVLCQKVYRNSNGDICNDIVSNRQKLNMIIGKNDPYVFYVGFDQQFYMFPSLVSTIDNGYGVTETSRLSGISGISKYISRESTKNSSFSPFYCSVKNFNQKERNIMDEFVEEAINISPSLKIGSFNQEAESGQWKFQVGPSEIIDGCDDLIMARFLMSKIANKHGYSIFYNLKPKINTSSCGCHINISTHKMRMKPSGEDGTNGIHHIIGYLDFLKDYHKDMVMVSGKKDDAPKMDTYSFKIGASNVSCRIPMNVKEEKCGYFEDRRTDATVDPYQYMYKHYMCYMRFVEC